MTNTVTYSKTFAFRRVPAIRTNPLGWSELLHRRGLGDLSWMSQPVLDAAVSRSAIATHMPELLPDYDALCALTPGNDAAAQYMAQYNNKPWWSGCSQTVAQHADRKTLLRNYDMGIDDFSDTFLCEALADGGWIIGSMECGWGYLDGLNDRGLAVSITFGGRFVAGDGFGVPIIVRYLLQTASTVPQAVAILERLPHRLAQNLLLLDREGRSAVVYTSPDNGVEVLEEAIACTNQQTPPPSPQAEAFTHTGERLAFLQARAGQVTVADMFQPPLYNRAYAEHFGTLYTVDLDPVAGTATYGWPERTFTASPQTADAEISVTLHGSSL